MINFLNLEYFLVAAEELNFTKAAKRLYISQQSLSNHIANLEKEMKEASRRLEFEYAAILRDQIIELRGKETTD